MIKKTGDGDVIYGLNTVKSAMSGSRRPTRILISFSHAHSEIAELAAALKIEVESVDNRVLERLTHGRNHQGFAAFVPPFHYADLRETLREYEGAKSSLVLVLDGIEDPSNLGSLLRTSSCFGIDFVIIAKDRQVQVTPTVSKVSTGAEQFVKIVQVSNIATTLAALKKSGYWIVAGDGSGDRLYDEVDYGGRMAIVIGSEGRGVSRLVLQNSDFVARIPIEGPITSLNAAVAGAIMIAQAAAARRK